MHFSNAGNVTGSTGPELTRLAGAEVTNSLGAVIPSGAADENPEFFHPDALWGRPGKLPGF